MFKILILFLVGLVSFLFLKHLGGFLSLKLVKSLFLFFLKNLNLIVFIILGGFIVIVIIIIVQFFPFFLFFFYFF
jgi:hypothetical protein